MRCFVILVLAGMACSGRIGGLSVPMPDADLTTVPLSPDGTAYPTTGIGGQPRTAMAAGQIFPNLTLQGIRSVATIDEPAVVSMAELYDPSGERFDLLHVIAVYFWCPHCNNETHALAKTASWRAEHRVAVLEIAMQDYRGASPGWSDLQKWVRDHNCDFPVVVDAQGAQLGQYFKIDAVPVNIMIAPRTMEILAVDVGEATDVTAYEQWFLTGS